YRFSGLEVDKIMAEHAELAKEVEELLSILNSDQKVKKILVKEFMEIKTKFPEPRKTKLISNFEDKDLADLIPSQEVMVSITQGGFIKRYGTETEQNTERSTSIVFTGDDVVRHVTKANMAERVLVLGSDAKVYPLKVFSIPEMRRYGKGVDAKELLKLKDNISIVGVFDETTDPEIIVFTKKGYAKRIKLEEFKGIKANGVSAFGLRKDDEVFSAELINSKQLAILEDKGVITKVKIDDVELSPRGKAPVKIVTTFNGYTFMQDAKDQIVLVYSSGSVGKPSSSKDKAVGIISLSKGYEYVAVTGSGKYMLINLSESIVLEASDRIEKVFTYYN
ncbi:MAG: DNA gyrase C-terminal beta-propeller domain-containing protein, partial [bacterium]